MSTPEAAGVASQGGFSDNGRGDQMSATGLEVFDQTLQKTNV